MRTSSFRLFGATLLATAFICVFLAQSHAGAEGGHPKNPKAYSFPVLFIGNAGQWDSSVLFAAMRPGMRATFSSGGFRFLSSSPERTSRAEIPAAWSGKKNHAGIRTVSCEFLRPSKDIRAAGMDVTGALANFYFGNDPARWHDSLGSYRGVWYHNVWKDIDIQYSSERGTLVQTIVLGEHANLRDIAIRITGADGGLPVALTEAYALVAGKHQRVAASISSRNGLMKIQASLPERKGATFFRMEFSTFFGGDDRDWILGMATDSSGCIYTCGSTSSHDLPIKNAWQASMSGKTGGFVAKYSCFCDSLLFCTYIAGNIPFSNEDLCWDIRVAKSSEVLVSGISASLDFPTTPDALQKNRGETPAIFLSRFSSSGRLIYSTFTPSVFVGNTYAMGDGIIQKNGNVVIAGNTNPDRTNIAKYLTSDAAQKDFGGGPTDAFMMILNPTCDSVRYCTYLGGDVFDQALSVGLDEYDNIIVCGGTGGDFPLVNAFDTSRGGTPTNDSYIGSVFLVKYSPDGKRILLSTFLNNYNFYSLCDRDPVASDHEGNTFSCITTFTPGKRTTDPMQSDLRGTTDVFITKISPANVPIKATYFGGTSGEFPIDAKTDACGNLHLWMITGSDGMPLVHSLYDKQERCLRAYYYCVFDPDLSTILFSTYWSCAYGNIGSLFVDENGCVYLSGARGATDVPIFNAYQPAPYSDNEAYFTRLYVPLCGSPIRVELRAPGKIRYDRLHGRAIDKVMPVTAVITNTDATRTANIGQVTFSVPAPLLLAHGARDTIFVPRPGALGPGASMEFTFMVNTESTLALDTALDARISVEYLYADTRPTCPTPFVNDVVAMPVEIVEVPYYKLSCTLDAPDSVAATASGAGGARDTVTLSCTVRNTGASGAVLRALVFASDEAPGVRLLSQSDTAWIASALAPNDDVTAAWRLEILPRQYRREILLAVVCIDTFGVAQIRCEKMLAIPALPGLDCRLEAPDTLRFDAGSGAYLPDPFAVAVTLTNQGDTAVAGVEADLILPGSTRLATAPGEDPHRQRVYVDAGSSVRFTWKLRVASIPPTDAGENIVVRYCSGREKTWGECSEQVVIVAPMTELSCAVTVPDSLELATSGTVLSPNPFAVRLDVTNGGEIAAEPRTARLSMLPGGRLSSAEDTIRRLGRIPSHRSERLEWTVLARTSRFDAMTHVSATVMDSLGAVLASCSRAVFLPGLPDDLSCSLTAPDTIAYNVRDDTHTPNPFAVRLTLANMLDTAQQAVEAEIDLSSSSHLALAGGEPAAKRIDSLPAQGNEAVQWNLEVRNTPVSPVTDRVIARYRHTGDTSWSTCMKDIVIEGEERIVIAVCTTAGHDSIFADVRYEQIIPQPVQLQYTITNNGNAPLAGCSAAIILPAGYALADPRDSIQNYGRIDPGKSVSREWLFYAEENRATPGTNIIRWKRECEGLDADSSCARELVLASASPAGIVFSPWLLRFSAERDGAMPPSKSVDLWTGGRLTMPWLLQSSTSWLDYQPPTGDARQVLTIGPTTTSLAQGEHIGHVAVASNNWVSPQDITVHYEIVQLSDADGQPAPETIRLGQSYPNPARTAVRIEFDLAQGGYVSLTITDLLGRRVDTISEGELSAGVHCIRYDVSGLTPGLYLYTLAAMGRTMTRVMAVR